MTMSIYRHLQYVGIVSIDRLLFPVAMAPTVLECPGTDIILVQQSNII